MFGHNKSSKKKSFKEPKSDFKSEPKQIASKLKQELDRASKPRVKEPEPIKEKVNDMCPCCEAGCTCCYHLSGTAKTDYTCKCRCHA